MFKTMHKHLGYLQRLRKRIDATGFPADDKLRLAVTEAQAAMERLATVTNSLAVDALMRKKPKR